MQRTNSEPVIIVSMAMQSLQFGFRVTVELGKKKTSFFHAGNNQKEAFQEGERIANSWKVLREEEK
jgi:hypothetical protein